MDLEFKKILEYVGMENFIKGRNYYCDVDYIDCETEDDIVVHIFLVESESFYDTYNVIIRTKKNEIISSNCECKQFEKFHMCKHIAASLLQYKDEIFKYSGAERQLYLSKLILDEFYEPNNQKGQGHLKKQLHLDLELETIEYRYQIDSEIKLNFKIGTKKMYILNKKFSSFLHAYETQKGDVVFGKELTYNFNDYFFSKEDEQIINYLSNLLSGRYSSNLSNLTLSMEEFSHFIKLIKNKSFIVRGYGVIDNVEEANPLQLSLNKKDGCYKLSLKNNGFKLLTSDYKYVLKDRTLFIVPNKFSKIFNLMTKNKIKDISFVEEDLPSFKNGILPIIRNNLVLDKTVQDDIVLGAKPIAKLYFDIKENLIICNLKFDYQGKEVDSFVEDETLVRDTEEENKVIGCLLNLNFKIENNIIYADDIETIAYLLEEGFNELAKEYEVFTSENLKKTKIIRNSSIRSSFSIGEDNIMSYQFDLGGIKNEEINSILDAYKQKEKYYRMKNGDILNLDENGDLQQFDQLVESMNLSKKDIKNGNGVIPKYRAIYLDSLKKEKFNIISTNNLFDNLIEQFNSYKDLPISLSSKDKKVLRDYQEVGVKWLYNISKCGFGGILADEMGLGKSIQLIYLIKQIVKEKKDALFLIVAPTSLVYNWKNEFDKFGSELKYKVFAENRSARKQELDNIKNTQILITTYGLVRQDKEIYENMNFELIAIDEAQTIKNNNAQMTRVIKNLHANTKIALTGTPLENSVMELWSIFDFIMPGYLAEITQFQRKYNIKNISEDEIKNLDSLKQQIKPFILRRRKKDVVKELPPKIENTISIDLNEEQKKIYIATLKKTRQEMDEILKTQGFKKGNFKILQLLTKLRQLCIDPSIIYDNYKGGSAKIENLVEIVKGIIENDHKILLFTSFKTALDIVKKEFDKNNITSYVIDGSVSSKKRMELVDKFNNDDTNVFLITLKAGGTGLNLTSADVVIHLDLWWNPQVENQATDRAHRIGQTNSVEVIKLVCKGTIEERILELQNKKKILSDALIEGKDRDQNLFSKLTEKDIKNLLTLDNEED